MRVRQIIPADGWYGALAFHPPGEEPEVEMVRVAAWALVEDDRGRQRIRGVDAEAEWDITFVDEWAFDLSDDENMSWLEYVHADDLTAEVRESLQRQAEMEVVRGKYDPGPKVGE